MKTQLPANLRFGTVEIKQLSKSGADDPHVGANSTPYV